MKINEKQKSINLRTQGLSITEIAKKLGVSKASVFGWTKEVALTEDQKSKLRHNKNQERATSVWVEKCKNNRLHYEDIGRAEINRKDWEHVAGCMLWWAEGDKQKNVVAITNSDKNILKTFIGFLKKYYHVSEECLKIFVQYHGDLDEKKLGEYWKAALDIPNAKVQKGYKKEKKSSSTKYPNGICRVRLYNTEIACRLWGSVQGYIGFSCPDGLSK